MNPERNSLAEVSRTRAEGASGVSFGVNPVLSLIRGYRRLNQWLRDAQVPGIVYTQCKFHPSCSEYAELAIQKHGAWRGSLRALRRVLRCNPWSKGGIDYP